MPVDNNLWLEILARGGPTAVLAAGLIVLHHAHKALAKQVETIVRHHEEHAGDCRTRWDSQMHANGKAMEHDQNQVKALSELGARIDGARASTEHALRDIGDKIERYDEQTSQKLSDVQQRLARIEGRSRAAS